MSDSEEGRRATVPVAPHRWVYRGGTVFRHCAWCRATPGSTQADSPCALAPRRAEHPDNQRIRNVVNKLDNTTGDRIAFCKRNGIEPFAAVAGGVAAWFTITDEQMKAGGWGAPGMQPVSARPLDWYGPEDHDGYADPTDEIARVAAHQAEWDAAHSLSARMAQVWQFGFKTYLRIKNVMENLSS